MAGTEAGLEFLFQAQLQSIIARARRQNEYGSAEVRAFAHPGDCRRTEISADLTVICADGVDLSEAFCLSVSKEVRCGNQEQDRQYAGFPIFTQGNRYRRPR